MSIAKKSEIISANNVTITENERKIYKAGQLKLLQDSEYMNAKASGTAISVNDVNAVEHNVGCKLRSKNLFDASLIRRESSNGMSVEYEGDGIFHLYGTCATASAFQLGLCQTDIPVEIGSYYTISATLIEGSTDRNFCCFFSNSDDIPTTVNWINVVIDPDFVVGNTKHTVDITNKAFINKYWVYIFGGGNVGDAIDCRVRVQLEKGNVSTAYTPYINDFSGIAVSRYGKNLFISNKIDGINTGKYGTTNDWGYNIKIDTDGDDILVSSKTGLFYQVKFRGLELELGQTYTISIAEEPSHENSWGWCIEYADGTSYPNSDGNYKTSLTFTPNKEIKFIAFRFGWASEALENPIRLVKPQIELGTTATAHEPYIEPTTYTANADGIVEGITSISPNTTLLTNNNGVVINANYLRDIDTYIDNLITDVALSGGEA